MLNIWENGGWKTKKIPYQTREKSLLKIKGMMLYQRREGRKWPTKRTMSCAGVRTIWGMDAIS